MTEQCRNSEQRKLLFIKSGLVGRDQYDTFEAARLDKYNKGLYNYLQTKWDGEKWLYIYSQENGTGKSYTANAIANMLINKGIAVVVEREVDMASKLQDTFNDKSGESEYALMGRWKSIPVLIIQDFGKYGSKSEWWPQHIFDVIDKRVIENKTTVITSNYNIENFEAIEKRFGENHGPAIYSRLNGQCEIFNMAGPDRRITT